MAKKITFAFYIGDEKVDTVPDSIIAKMSDNLSKTMSVYYSERPQEYKKFIEKNGDARGGLSKKDRPQRSAQDGPEDYEKMPHEH